MAMTGRDGAQDVTVKVIIDVILLCLSPLPSLIFEVAGTPFHRGFFCDDESISYPYKNDTVPLWAVALVGISLPLIVMLFTEMFIYMHTSRGDTPRHPPPYGQYVVCNRSVHSFLVAIYCAAGPFLFGLAINQVSTDITKYAVGRLRPNFLSVCIPDYSTFSCTDADGFQRYITEDVCTGDAHEVKEARLSHPSGHSSCSTYCAVYLMLYLNAKLVWRGSRLLRYFLGMIVLYLALYTCTSRISDYKHHPTDVLGGAALGAAVAIVVGVYVARLGVRRPARHLQQSSSRSHDRAGVDNNVRIAESPAL